MMPNIISSQTVNITLATATMPLMMNISEGVRVDDEMTDTTLAWDHNYPIYHDGYIYYDDYYNYSIMCNTNMKETMDHLTGYRLCIQILLPIICTIGIVGITLTVMVLSQKNMSTSTNNYLISLAIADLCFLIIMAAKCFETKFDREHYYMYAIVMTYAHVFLTIFLMVSIWLTVMLAVERYIAICHPLRAMAICTVVRARIIILSIFVISFACRLPSFFKYKIITFHDHCIQKDVIWHEITDFGNSELFWQIYSWSDCVLSAILPFSALLILNGCLIREIHRSTNYLRYHLASDSNVQTIIISEEIRITLMLISVVVVFFICEAPFVLLTSIKSLGIDTPFIREHFNLLTYITILLLVLRSSFNFILYCWFSEKFWNTFKRTFCMLTCIMSRAPSWFRSRVIGNNSEHAYGHSNNNPRHGEMVEITTHPGNGHVKSASYSEHQV